MVKIKVEPGVKIGTFARAKGGGRIIMDGTTVRADNATIGKMFDADTGASISAKGFTADMKSGEPPRERSPWIKPIMIGLIVSIVSGVILAVIKGWLPGLS